MANSESIRYFTVGRENVTGVLAATMTAYPFLTLTQTPKKTILQPKEFRGTRGMENTGLSGVQSSETKLKVQGYYDLLGWILAAAFNAPTDATLDTSAKSHIFRTGLGSVPSNSLQFSYGVGTGVAIWEQVLGAQVEQIDFSFAADKLVEVDVTWVSPMATVIAAPSTPTFSIASYVHPFGQSGGQSVTVSGSGFGKLISAKVSVKNNRTPLYTMQSSADPSRFIEGAVQVTFDLVADYTADAASFYNNYRTNTLPGAIVIQAQDGSHLIGASTAFPTFKLTLPLPRITSANLTPDSKGNTTASVKGTAEYYGTSDTVGPTIVTVELDNVVASYPAS
jgi:tail tube protein